MKRLFYFAIVLTMLLGMGSSAFAAEPQRVEQTTAALLGEVWWFYFDFGSPGLRVDAYLYRPSTLDGWPWDVGPDYGTWWWTGPESEMRRQSWPAYAYTDTSGYYYAEFMLPRDEAWYPCSFPLKWKCNYVVGSGDGAQEATAYHSPASMAYECRNVGTVVECLQWPWDEDPMDTISPLEVWLVDEFGYGYVIPFEVLGMYWKFSDFE